MSVPRPVRSLAAAASALCLGVTALVAPVSSAVADEVSEPAEPAAIGGDPTTVSADALPTVQVDGVVWDQVVVGGTVYAVGSFSSARPAGAAAGVGEVARGNVLAYDIATGELLDWAPVVNGVVNSVDASADGSVVYLGGDFTSLNGEVTWRVGSVDAVSGRRVPVGASANGSVKAVEVSADGSTLYVGGAFTQVNSSARQRVAAVDLATQKLTSFSAQVDNLYVRTIVTAPDSSAVAIGGAFTSVEGSDKPGFGVAVLENDGSLRRNNISSVVRSAGINASVMDLEADEQGLYGVAYSMTGSFEGMFRANWETGDLDVMADCHGDSYDLFPTSEVVYVSSHAHDCRNIGGFPEQRRFHNAVAYTNYATGTVETSYARGYHSYPGQPAATNLNFYPEFKPGTITRTNQATWTVEGNDEYVVYGGEFLSVNGTAQQGLVRFARRDIAPNQQGPMNKGGAYKVTASSSRAGVVTVSFPGNWDRDDKTLTYSVYRDTRDSEPISTQTVTAGYWELPNLSATDVVEPGSTHRYRVVVTDPWGAWTHSDWVTVTAAEGEALSDYGARVLTDGAAHYWPLDEESGEAAQDLVAERDLRLSGSSYSWGAESVLGSGSALSLASDRNSQSSAATATSSVAPTAFSVEAWVRTTSSSGGAVVGFGSSATGSSASYDRVVYMRNDGTLSLMLNPGAPSTVTTSESYNDGQWHHVVASLSPTAGATLYVDGRLEAFESTMTTGQSYTGFWRVGGDTLEGVSGAPSTHYIEADVDEVAVYGVPLGPSQVAAHYTLGSGKEVAQDEADADAPAVGDVLLADDFDRTTTRGWGSAPTGGPWKVTWNAPSFSTDESQGRIAMEGARSSSSVSSQEIDSTSTETVLDFSLDSAPGGNGAFVSYVARANDAGRYQATMRVGSAGAPVVTVAKVVGGLETALGTIVLDEPYTAGQDLHLRLVVSGEESTTLQARFWAGDTEPQDWGVDVVDTEKTLNEAGTVGITTYMSGSAGPETVTLAVSNLTVTQH
ncbi:LamG domain-containing protein [Actinomyces wuliandei]|uniref:LamG domain-containing protein n=1 Tax=Actinomyces wuliandei TaxID=2057743 RepID=UPI000FD8E0BB|nr:LamG domain-containing protein [Actinomyces wuliandei]